MFTNATDGWLGALGLSVPQGGRPTPQTKSEVETALTASQAATRARPQISADWCAPERSHCGFTNRRWLHSFRTTNWLTLEKRRATAAAHAPNCWMRYVSPHDSGSLEGEHLLPPVKAIECAG